MRTVEITLRITYDENYYSTPVKWNWEELIGEDVEVVDDRVVE